MNRAIADTSVFRLTALWGLCESGLGGWMHALGLPFTGFFVGGFAVVMIGMIAYYTGRNFRQIIQATVLVILVKAAVSPHSSVFAYIAVAFQGLIGALFFSLIKSHKVASVLVAVIAMLESAMQKVLVLTLYYGKSIWEAVNSFFETVVKDLYLPSQTNFSLWIIILYTTIYFIWGMVLGAWMGKLPSQILTQKNSIQTALPENRISLKNNEEPKPMRKNKYRKLFFGFLVLSFIVLVIVWGEQGLGKAGYVVCRAIAVMLVIVYILTPLVRYILQRFASKNKSGNENLQKILSTLPELKTYIKPAYQLASEYKGFKRFQSFVLTMIVFTLHPEIIER